MGHFGEAGAGEEEEPGEDADDEELPDFPSDLCAEEGRREGDLRGEDE